MNIRFLVPVSCLLLISACASNAKPPAAPPEAASTPTPQVTAQKSPDRSMVQIADEIRKACGVSDEDAYFAFDSSKLTSRESGVLHRVAVCFESGPLSGRSMRVVGHTDPRGSADYNLVLGGSRADSVKNYLHRQGLPDARMASTSRGAMDAEGTDDASWAKDRRVDLQLAN